jgi:hypothetical protein
MNEANKEGKTLKDLFFRSNLFTRGSMIDEKPKARRNNLEVQELPDETLIYDLERHKAHCLNRSVALVWRLSDGTHTIPELAALLQRELRTPITEEVIRIALSQLQKTHLLEIGILQIPSPSRRQVMRVLGRAAWVPTIASMLAPRAIQAATCNQIKNRAAGCSCDTPGLTFQCDGIGTLPGTCSLSGKCL